MMIKLKEFWLVFDEVLFKYSSSGQSFGIVMRGQNPVVAKVEAINFGLGLICNRDNKFALLA
jgi:hypothetical protein